MVCFNILELYTLKCVSLLVIWVHFDILLHYQSVALLCSIDANWPTSSSKGEQARLFLIDKFCFS